MNAIYQRLAALRDQPNTGRRARRAGGLETEAGEAIGRDPRAMTAADFQALGHRPAALTEVIRAKCLDCCCGSAYEARRCISIDCPLWPFRMGTNPLRKPVPEERRRAIGDRLRSAVALRRTLHNSGGLSAPEGVPATPLPETAAPSPIPVCAGGNPGEPPPPPTRQNSGSHVPVTRQSREV
jgi:hypothetical protein